jgi:hypothetical protein
MNLDAAAAGAHVTGGAGDPVMNHGRGIDHLFPARSGGAA